MNSKQQQPLRRKSSPWTILSLYIMVAAIIGIFVWFVSSKSGSETQYFAGGDLKYVETETTTDKNGKLTKILLSEKVTELYISDKTARLELSGKYKVATTVDNKEVIKTYYFEGVFPTVKIETLQEILDSRVIYQLDANGNPALDQDGKQIVEGQYYTAANVSTTDPYASNFFADYLPMILLIGVGLLGAFFLMSRLTKSMGKGGNDAMMFDKSRARKEIDSKVRFADVAGIDEVKAEFVEIVDYLKNGEKYTRLGAKLPKGVLLVGPPGTGKTMIAKAVAGEAQVPFYSISGSDFVEMFVGVGAGRVRDMFKTAKENAPCLIFIDEIDAVGRQRGAGLGGGNDEREQTLNQLLVEMDGFKENVGIIVMAATNREDVLDPALLRAGRFDRQITVDLPDVRGREEILRVHARNKKIDPNIDFAQIAKRTVGFSGADIANILNEAAILAVREKRTFVITKDIDEAIDRTIAGPAKSNRSLSEHEKKSIAYHEAGHTIIGLKLPYSDKVQKVTIIPRGRTGGHVLMTPENDRFILTKKELMARIVGYLGGRTSEEVFFKDISTGASNDIHVATRLARSMVTEYGMSKLGPIQYESGDGNVFLGRDYTSTQKNFSSQIAFEIDNEVRSIIEEAHIEAEKIISKYRDDVILIAETLIKVETINSEQIAYLLEHREMPPEEVTPTYVEPTSTVGETVLPSNVATTVFPVDVEEYNEQIEKIKRELVEKTKPETKQEEEVKAVKKPAAKKVVPKEEKKEKGEKGE